MKPHLALGLCAVLVGIGMSGSPGARARAQEIPTFADFEKDCRNGATMTEDCRNRFNAAADEDGLGDVARACDLEEFWSIYDNFKEDGVNEVATQHWFMGVQALILMGLCNP